MNMKKKTDCPVAALNLAWPFATDYSYAWYWVTITKYFSNTDGTWIAVSTRGQRKYLDFDVYYDYAYLFGGGFAFWGDYFHITVNLQI